MSEIPLRRYVEVRRAGAPALSSDGQQLAYVSDLTGYPEAWLHTGAGREPRMLTEFRERVGRVRFTPDGRQIVLDTDLGGDERWAIRSVRPDGQGHRSLSHDPGVVHLLGEIARDGARLSCATNSRDAALFDVGLIDLETGRHQPLFEGDGSHLPGPFSPDGRWVLATRLGGSFRQDLLLVSTGDGRGVPLTEPASPGAAPEARGAAGTRHLEPAFEPSGESLLLLTDRARDFLGVARLSLETREVEWIYAPPDRDVEHLAVADDGRVAVAAENLRGLSRLVLLHPDGAQAPVPVEHPAGIVSELAISGDGSRVAFSLGHAGSPSEVYLLDPASGQVERATRSPREEVPEEALVHPEEVRYASFDGTEIPGWLYLPPGHTRRVPAVIKVHGGPESQARPEYDPIAQFLLSRGIAVFEPNVRGSTGYGRAFAALDDRELRFDAVKDLAAAAGFLRETGRIDPDRISLLGGSYGGFMVLAGLAFFPDLWAAGVSICGIANFRTFLRNTSPYRRAWRIAEYGDPEEDGEFLDSISPVHHAEQIRAPLLVIQGANDPRVPRDEAEQIVHAVGGRGGIAQYLLLRDEGHGVVKLGNRLKAWQVVAKFLARY